MTSRSLFSARLSRRGLLFGTSLATLAMGLAAMPAQAQTLGATLGAQGARPRPPVQQPGATPRRSPTMQAALARQQSTQGRIAQIRAYATSLRQAADRGPVADGLDPNGLDPTDAIREAIAAVRAGDTARANQLLISAGAASDATGLKTWEGAGLPSQTRGADGKVTVVIDQTQERALLSWNRFDIGANTTLQFNQKSNGVAQPGWVAVNRVTNSTDPSLILGNLKADGTVVVLNRSGIIFGKNSQVNTHSLLASTLDLGNAARFTNGSGGATQATTLKERNSAYLELGLFTPPNGTTGDVSLNVAALLVSGMTSGDGTHFSDTPEGGIVIDPGARITGGDGGFLILTAPDINNAGVLSAVDGQVSLQAGRAIGYAQSTGADTDIDPFVRGYKLNSYGFGAPTGGVIVNSGLIDSTRGYLSLGTGADGTITHSGLLSTTTSVSRNGKISLTAGTITLAGNQNAAMASGIEMLADDNGETIPVGSPDEPASFKTSQLEIGTQVDLATQFTGALVATDLRMGQNALIYAPGANVSIGANTISDPSLIHNYDASHPGHVDIATGATIDVSGLKDVQLDASRNSIEIDPVKRGELRDTPNYREVALDGNFTLNGATLYVDPRLSGVRDDGVAWVGSPLIEAGSIAGQIPATAAEFMTKGGTVSLATSDLQNFNNVSVATAPSIHIAKDAVIDFSGGWVSYAAGTVKTSRLITDDGRIVDIAKANPNDTYVGAVNGYTDVQPRFGILTTHLNAAGQGQRFDAAYDEGRDAGALTILAAAVAIDGTFYGNAFAGSRQIAAGNWPSLIPTSLGRALQTSPYELPSGGSVSIASLGDMIVYHGNRGAAESDWSELLLSDDMLSGAGLSELTLDAAGSVTFAGIDPLTLQPENVLDITGVSNVELAPGGILSVTAGRAIRFDGGVTVASGTIVAETVAAGTGPGVLVGAEVSNGSVFRHGLYGDGNGDDLPQLPLYSNDPGDLNPFDITVSGTLSTAGLWVNDFTEAGVKQGGAFGDGGSISLTAASNVFAAVGGSLATAREAIDLSGSIRVSGTLNVSAGGYVTPTGNLVLDGKGGDVSLINRTVYASTRLTNAGSLTNDGSGLSDIPIDGDSQSVEFTSVPAAGNASAVLPRLVATPSSTVDISTASIKGFGFAGGGTFTLVAPDISFGSNDHAGSTHIGFDFFKATGFGTLDASSYRSRIIDDVFDNGTARKSAFLETTRFVVGAGETFDLTQWMLPTLLSAEQSKALRVLGTGADVLAQPFLSPTTNDALWDRRAANLVLGGLTELDVLAGGQIISAPGASLTVAKLYNDGSIVLHGGTISQRTDLVSNLIVGGLGVRDSSLGGDGLADAFGGGADEQGLFSEDALNAAGVVDPRNGRVLTNRQLVSGDGIDRLIYFEGMVDDGDGIVLAAGSSTDLSGIAMLNPRAPFTSNGTRTRVGQVLDGGSIRLAASTIVGSDAARRVPGATGTSGRRLVRDDDAQIDISGANLVVDQATGLGNFTSYLEWSKAGTISALAGGTLGTSAIDARGGDDRAEGGTLEWLDPIVGSGDGSAQDYLSAEVIADSGFDTVNARGSLTLDGDFSLSLRKALMVTSRDPSDPGNPFTSDANIVVKATAGTHASLAASYIRFGSRLGTPGIVGTQEGDATVLFMGGAQGIDVAGGVTFDSSIASLTLATPGDVRLIGVSTNTFVNGEPTYDGNLFTRGDLTIDAGRVYATTGTGNLQAILEGGTTGLAPFTITALGDHTITFGNSFLDPGAPTPLSAGSYLRVVATHIDQNGYLAAPLGVLELGDASTQSITFGPGSVTTVSGAGLNIPYGTTTDGIDYFFPTVGLPITKLPSGELRLTAGTIDQKEGALFDGRGGGDVYAYEFQSGVGGSRDVLDRFNSDAFSSNGYDPATGIGYQYPDQRQVFALVPADQASKIAPYDPIYSSDYGAAGLVDLYGAQAGRTVHLDGGNGIAAGDYLLVPAKYAMSIPGALRLVENSGTSAPVPGKSTTLLDGSVVVGGTYGYAGTGISESTRYSFTLQTKDTFTKYSSILTTRGSDYLTGIADKNGTGRPRLPLDSARVVLAPLTALKLAGVFDTTPVNGGQGGQFDILGSKIVIAAEGDEAPTGSLLISDATLARLDAPSLLIGGRRTENTDGTTTIAATATSITVASGAHLQAPELLLAVGGAGSTLTIEDGASVSAAGAVGTQSSSDYVASGPGSLLRVANAGERLVTRTGTGASTIKIGAASLSGTALALDTSGSFIVSNDASLTAKYAAISGSAIQFNGDTAVAGQAGVIGAGLEAKLAGADRLTVRSPGAIRFSGGEHKFNDLVLDTAALAATAGPTDAPVTIDAGNVTLLNSTAAANGCATVGVCGAGSSFALNAATLSFGTNDVVASFADTVTLAGSDGMYVEGKGSFSTGDASLTLTAPFLAERSAAVDPRDQKVRPDYTFLTTGDVSVSAAGTNSTATIDGNAAPGARIGFGTIDDKVASLTITGSTIRATAGIIDLESQGDISLAGATLSVPGYEQTFGDEVDPVVVSAGGGTINLLSANGNIATDAASTLISDSGVGNAGTLNLLASNGTITFDASINPDAKGPRQGSLSFDSGTGAFDLAGFVTRYGTLFGGDVWVRSGTGDLDVTAGQSLKAKSVTLTADGGSITISGTIDTSGVNVAGMSADAARDADVNGGDIQLWGNAGVTLTSTALLDTHTTGYADTDSRVASAGNVTIGIERQDAAINISDGAIIDVGARRTQADPGVGRMVPQTIGDPVTGNPVTVYTYAEPDQGGTVDFRAPVIGANRDKVALSQRGSILGADSIQLEAFQRYDLDAIADSGSYTGITRAPDGTIDLDFGAAGANPFTTRLTLDDGTSSLVQFIQDFDVSTVDGSSLDGMRLRPGVELASKGGIETTTQWNLAAANFSPEQLQAAVGAGDLAVIPELSEGGGTQYRVVPGREGDLLDRFVTFLYRTDGGSARGEAPVVTFRAGGDLTINRSISDGFFTFRDKSDSDYLNWQLGGGDRTYQPAIQITCGSQTGSCANIASYGSGANPGTAQTLTISLNSAAVQGALDNEQPNVNSPLSLAGNGADGGGDTEDALGFAELFPLLDGNVAMHSSDLRLVAGAGDLLSANPLQVNRALAADVTVRGDYSYRVLATGTVGYDGPLQFHLFRASTDSTNVNFNIGDTLNLTDPTAGLNQLKDDAYTTLTWGNSAGLGADARAAARAYFAGKGYTFTGNAANPTGVTAPLNEILGFLQTFEPTYQAGLASGRTGYTANRTPPIIQYGTTAQQTAADSPNQAHVRTYIRTGDGDISVVASRDVDLRGGAQAVYRKADGTLASGPTNSGTNLAAQFAASAIYTAGTRVAASDVEARIAGSGDLISISPDSPYLLRRPEDVTFIPSPRGNSDNQPVLAHGGGDILLDAGRDVLGRRDVWTQLVGLSGQAFTGARSGTSTAPGTNAGQQVQAWRTGSVGNDTEVGISPRYFTSGVGALAGGDVTIDAGRDVSDLMVALDSTSTTTTTEAGKVMLSFGSGNLALAAGGDVLAGAIDVASGVGVVHASGDIAALGNEPISVTTPQYLRVRLSDSVVNISAGGSATIGSVSALSVDQSASSAGFFSPDAAFELSAVETAQIAQTNSIGGATEYGQQASFFTNGEASSFIQVLPPTLDLTSLTASVVLPQNLPQLLYPSPNGQLRIFSNGDLDRLVIAMSDVDPGWVGGAFSAQQAGAVYDVPAVLASTTDLQLRRQHAQWLTHLGDDEPVRIYTNGDIDRSAVFLPKQARISAGRDIVDMFFQGQNLAASEITRIWAGRDIIGTVAKQGPQLPVVASNDFILGGPGTLIVEAGRDLGPFVTSVQIDGADHAGGIRTVGNDYNPWLPKQGADLQVRFGMAGGADYDALRETYLDPDNLIQLDGDLFVQTTDNFGNQKPDRSKPIYAPILAEWLRDKHPDLFAEVFGSQNYPNTDAGNAALANAAYGKMADLYTAFATLDVLHQQDFLINDLYFNELAAIGDAKGPSFNQYIRGYRAVNTLFPPSLGYTDNLAPYTLDPATITADHPLGEPVRNIVNGQPQVADRVQTGNVDLRLATFQTARGGDVTILGPGGDVIAGSAVRTSEQPARKGTVFDIPNLAFPRPPGQYYEGGDLTLLHVASGFDAVPLGYEGVLTLRGGEIRTFTDGDFLLNQSRVFSEQSGDIIMWSSNGDLAAGQGPKSASNFPPVTVRFDENGLSEVDSAGSVSGAGIGSFQRTPDDPASDVILIAPVGAVDAGDAGVRASGNIVVAAARVANADNFKAAGSITGVPTAAITTVTVTPTDPTADIRKIAAAAQDPDAGRPRHTIITVDIAGPTTEEEGCPDSSRNSDQRCP